MKNIKFNISRLITPLIVVMFTAGCKEQTMMNTNETNSIFPKGERGSAEYFTGNAWNIGLVENDSVYNTVIGNVYFEPGARSNWHKHPSGQILVITEGEGYHQIKGEPRQTIRKGDVIKCPPNTIHWHGASHENGLHQLYILPKTENGIVEWMQPVSEDEYNAK